MKIGELLVAGLVGVGALAGCSSSSEVAAEPSVYTKLGGAKGVTAVVSDFLTQVKADPEINGYFLNSSLDQDHLASCLEKQIGSLTGGPEKYDCKTMKDAHKDLGISQHDFDTFIAHLSDALVAAKVASDDIDAIVSVLNPMSADIVTDPTNDATIYQRVGRKPGIQTVVTRFHANVAADAVVSPFFASTNMDRLGTCLTRQVCQATGGPCKYGEEITDAEPGIKSPCADMKSSHASLDIGYSDFTALAGDFVKAMDSSGVTPADRDAIGGVLGSMCTDIVTNTTRGTCPAPAGP